MNTRRWTALFAAIALVSAAGWNYVNNVGTGTDMTRAANAFLKTLYSSQRETVLHEYDSPARVDWHFIPKDERKGLQVRHMVEPQRKAALELLRSCLSEAGYDKARQIMELESILYALEGSGGGNIRDSQRYYVSIFGEPRENGRWGLSIEGHHLSLNFVVDGGKVISSTPTFFAANPATVKNEVQGGLPVGTQVLKEEEEIAFTLVNSLTEEQRKQAILADKAPREIRGPAGPQPAADESVGIAYGELNDEQRQSMRSLVHAYLDNLPEDVGRQRLDAIRSGGTDKVRFAWAGATEPGVGHYYRVQGPTFLIEFVNTQPDPAGNIANHIHAVWRDMHGDFAIAAGE